MNLTASQKANLAALLVGLGSIVAAHTSDIESAFPQIHGLAPWLAVICLLVTSLGRSLNTANSGTGGGVINGGPDPKAAPTLAAPTAADPQNVQYAPPLSVGGPETGADAAPLPLPARTPDGATEAASQE